MSTAWARLQEKIDVQNTAAANLKERFYEAMTIAVKDGGFCIDELNYFGMKVFREIVAQMRTESPEE
ncbi:hypothetical protein LCGC14_0782730 [marine sediment metagenome]|uniref:Uncharacterized protein n=1 Tax=marine sediment metagenome TaxID=412755 RepID=A0A0F9PZA4_9ZZZZ